MISPFNQETVKFSPETAMAMLQASEMAYQSCTEIRGALSQSYQIVTVGDIQAIVIFLDKSTIVAFRGTISEKEGKIDISNWITDANAYFTMAGEHAGFAAALDSIWISVLQLINTRTTPHSLWLTGHSMGGALAMLAARRLYFKERIPFNGVYTFGQPRSGSIVFCATCQQAFGNKYFRFVNDEDIVTRIPPRQLLVPGGIVNYDHCGQVCYFDADGEFHTDEHYWLSFLQRVKVGFEALAGWAEGAPIKDHFLSSYQLALSKLCQPV